MNRQSGKIKLNKIDGCLDHPGTTEYEADNNKREVLMEAVEGALSNRFSQQHEDKYQKEMLDLKEKVQQKEDEINSKYLALMKEQEEVEALEKKYAILKTDVERTELGAETEVERLQHQANAQEIKNAKPQGVIGYISN